MGQWDQIERATLAAEPKRPADNFVEPLERNKLRNRKFPHRDDKPRTQEIDFIIHPRRTIPNLVRGWNAVSTRGGFSGETAADRCKINRGAHLRFVQMTKVLEPTEEGAARGPGKRSAQDRLSDSGCLTDQHDFAQDRPAGNRGREHAWTTPTLEQLRDVFVQQLLPARG